MCQMLTWCLKVYTILYLTILKPQNWQRMILILQYTQDTQSTSLLSALPHVKQRHKATCKSRHLHCKGRRQCPPVMRDSFPVATPGCKTQTWNISYQGWLSYPVQQIILKRRYMHNLHLKTATRCRWCPSKFWIHSNHFQTHTTWRRHTKENQNHQDQRTNQETVSRTLWRHRPIHRWTIPYSYKSIHYT